MHTENSTSSYRSIFKSSAIIGGQQFVRIFIGIVQAKVIALLLGTSGTGAFGVYASLLNLVQSFAGFGISGSGVRQVASAHALGDPETLGRTVHVLRTASLVLGVVGALVVFCLRRPIGRLTFGDETHAWSVGFIAVALWPLLVSSGQLAVLQGLRRIRELALANLAGTALGAAAAVTLVFFLHERGIAPAFAAATFSTLVGSWLFIRRIPVPHAFLRVSDVQHELRALAGLGSAFMATGLLAALSGYALRLMIVRRLGMDAAGFYQAGWTLSTFYVGIVLQAMGTDFLPRLTAAAHDRPKMNRLINEQMEMGAFMAAPGALAMIVFVPWLIRLLFTADFIFATSLTRWMSFAIVFRVACWPINYVQIALGRGRQMVATETVFHATLLAISAWCMIRWGLDGVGMGLLATYVPYTVGMYLLCIRMTGFRWSHSAFRAMLFLLVSVGAGFLVVQKMPGVPELLVGSCLTAIVTVVGLAAVFRLVGRDFFRLSRGKVTGRE